MGNRRWRVLVRGGALTAATVMSLGLMAGCSRGPNQKELATLEEQRQAAEAAEGQVAKKKAEQARLERRLADRKAEKRAAESRKASTEENLANFPKE